jgi:hypothetical protein
MKLKIAFAVAAYACSVSGQGAFQKMAKINPLELNERRPLEGQF